MQNSPQRSLTYLKGPERPLHLYEYLSQALQMSISAIQTCSELGAIYLNQDRIFSNPLVQDFDSIRIYKFPRRFSKLPLPTRSYIVAETKDYIVGLKPPMVLTHASSDNIKENFVYQMSGVCGHLRPLQRLDFITCGLVTMAKNAPFAKTFQTWNHLGRIKKKYLAWTERYLQTGHYEHEVYVDPSGLRIWGNEKSSLSKTCKLNILSVKPAQPFGFDVEIDLITGRTHQIRAQLAQLGSPIVGDAKFGSQLKMNSVRPSLTCIELEIPRGPNSIRYELPWIPFSAQIDKKENL